MPLLYPYLAPALLLVGISAATGYAVADTSCGSWQQSYTKLHADMIRGDVPARFAVATGPSGLADFLLGSVSVFYLALVSGRAFMMGYVQPPEQQHQHSLPHLEWAYTQPSINWTIPQHLRAQLAQSGSLLSPSKPWAVFDDSSSTAHTVLATGYSHWQKAAHPLWQDQDITQWAASYRTLHVEAARGMTWRLFDNPYVGPKLRALGVQRATAFACALDFLVDLQPEVKQRVAPMQRQLLLDGSHQQVLRIGIQIRTGDDTLRQTHRSRSLGDNDQLLTKYSAFFECAQEITQTRGSSYHKVVWYLVTDSVAIRQAAARRYGERIVTDQSLMPAHIHDQSARANNSAREAVQTSVSENWLLHLADAFVISEHSGFGRTAAFWSRRLDSIYTIRCCTNPGPVLIRRCGVRHADQLHNIVNKWSQI